MEQRDVLTVSEVTRLVRELLEGSFPSLWVAGEVSNLRVPASGHVYFTLKDEGAQLRCVMFRDSAKELSFRLEDGLAVVAGGRLSVYERRGDYQLIVKELEPAGRGALALAFEQLKERLEAEGLFAPERKRPIPAFPRVIGVVTSATGAAIRDILNVLSRRAAGLTVYLYPAKVQGEGAAEEIAAAVRAFSDGIVAVHPGETAPRAVEPEVLIVGRGGGSIEDLWAFNEEIVARAIAASRIPVISAVGHEIDFTIADFVADLRAPTPSAAAELVVAEREALLERVGMLGKRLDRAADVLLEGLAGRVGTAASSWAFERFPESLLQLEQRLDDAGAALDRALEDAVCAAEHAVERLAGRLLALSPLAVLSRGYAVVRRLPGMETVRDAAVLAPGDGVSVRVAKGSFRASVEAVEEG